MNDVYGGLGSKDVVERLGLQPHPEGGFFKETFRDPLGTDGRAHSTAIYYLLGAGDCSRWHRVDAVEIWHYYAGGSLALTLSQNGHDAASHRLGPNLVAGELPQVVVPKGCWQTAESLGQWTLAGCTVAPGFEFSGFEMAPSGWHPVPGSSGG